MLAVACALKDKYRFEPGSMVCVDYINSDHVLILTLAIIAIGGAVCCAYYKDPYAELLYLAKKVEPKYLFCHLRNLNWCNQLSADLGYQVVGVAMDGMSERDNVNCFDQLLNYDYKTQSQSLDSVPETNIKPLDKQIACVSMSSGTTGKPKAVSLSHYNALADLLSIRKRSTLKLCSAPCVASLDYVSGRILMFGAIQAGHNVVILDGFEPKTYLECCEKYQASLICLGAASFYNLITYEHIDQYDLSSVLFAFPMGAKIVYLDELAKFLAKHPNIRALRQGYGASELAGCCMNLMTPEQYLRDCDNCGKLLTGMQVKIVEPKTGRLLGPNEIGMIHAKGETVFPGYYDMEQARQRRATAQSKAVDAGGEAGAGEEDLNPFVWDESVFDSEGYYITGDLGYFNDQEELYVIGRQMEMMSCRGAKKVLPQELEEIVSTHPAVSEVCVLGVPNRRELTLHCPRAFIVPTPDCYNLESQSALPAHLLGPKLDTLNPVLEGCAASDRLSHVGQHKLCRMDANQRRLLTEDLMEFVDRRVGWEKQLTGGIVILDEIPTSRTGKIDKNFLRSLGRDRVEIYGDRSE